MSILLKKRPKLRVRITPDRVLAITAVTGIGVGLVQPAFLSMASLQDRPKTFAGQPIDPAPTGTIDESAKGRGDKVVHGLAGILRFLRMDTLDAPRR